jgi:sarcosine oxidase subunit gamma
MADLTMLRRSPLAHLAERMRDGSVGGPRGVALSESPYLTMVSLRVDATAPVAQRLEAVLGVDLPRACGTVTEAGATAVLWLGPDEWLVVSRTEAGFLTDQLQAAIQDAHASVVDVSANRTGLELAGPSARAVLEKGCPVDLHPTRFGPGTAVTTTLARIPLLLWQTGPETYRLLPRSSFADYVARWLLDAMEEFRSTSEGAGAS